LIKREASVIGTLFAQGSQKRDHGPLYAVSVLISWWWAVSVTLLGM
jgi:hypothetical protein